MCRCGQSPCKCQTIYTCPPQFEIPHIIVNLQRRVDELEFQVQALILRIENLERKG